MSNCTIDSTSQYYTHRNHWNGFWSYERNFFQLAHAIIKVKTVQPVQGDDDPIFDRPPVESFARPLIQESIAILVIWIAIQIITRKFLNKSFCFRFPRARVVRLLEFNERNVFVGHADNKTCRLHAIG